jgi:predicted transposase YbfD/YdcC
MFRQAKQLDWNRAEVVAGESRSWDDEHGRHEGRTVRRIDLSTVAGKQALKDFPGARQVIRVERKRCSKTGRPRTWAYYITSLAFADTDARRLAEIIRTHWLIENANHYVRDVVYGEDRCRCRTGNTPEILAIARSIGITYAAQKQLRHAEVHRVLGNDLRALSMVLGVWLAPEPLAESTTRKTA